jgi:hypothetical protein
LLTDRETLPTPLKKKKKKKNTGHGVDIGASDGRSTQRHQGHIPTA